MSRFIWNNSTPLLDMSPLIAIRAAAMSYLQWVDIFNIISNVIQFIWLPSIQFLSGIGRHHQLKSTPLDLALRLHFGYLRGNTVGHGDLSFLAKRWPCGRHETHRSEVLFLESDSWGRDTKTDKTGSTFYNDHNDRDPRAWLSIMTVTLGRERALPGSP